MTAELAPGCRVDAAFDPLSPAYLEDPYAILAALPLAEAPIGSTVRRLLEAPERWDAVVGDPALIPAAVDESLRFDPSVPVWRRITTRPVTLVAEPPGERCQRRRQLGADGRAL